MDHLDKLENKSVHIIREAYAAFSSLGSYRDAAEQLQRFTVVRGALTGEEIHVIRDATRGGVGTVLYEIAGQSGVGIRLDAASVPVDPRVRGVCGMLGLEPLYLACEGRLVIFAPQAHAEAIVAKLREGKYSQNAAIIGTVTAEDAGKVIMETEIGTQTILPQPKGELLPRIC